MKVLYMHGLQSPWLACLRAVAPLLCSSDSKGQYLRRHFPGTVAPDMHMSAHNPFASHSPARWCLPYLAIGCAAAAVAASRGAVAAAVAVLACVATGLVPLVRWRVRASLRACAAIQSAAIGHHKPDVVVASSFGGAVALACMRQDLWAGPTVLLAPAVAIKGWCGALVGPMACAGAAHRCPAAAAGQCVVVQGGADEVVDATAVEALCGRAGIRFVLIPEADHQLYGALARSGGLKAVVTNVATRGVADALLGVEGVTFELRPPD